MGRGEEEEEEVGEGEAGGTSANYGDGRSGEGILGAAERLRWGWLLVIDWVLGWLVCQKSDRTGYFALVSIVVSPGSLRDFDSSPCRTKINGALLHLMLSRQPVNRPRRRT